MTIADAFGAYSTTNTNILNTALLTFSIIGIQAILDSSFECPTNEYSPLLGALYSLSFFLCPAIAFIFLGLYYFPGFNKSQCCPCWSGSWACIYVVVQIGKPPLIYLLIAMTDGRFLSCFVEVVSNWQINPKLYLYIFQTSGMLAITLMVIVWYYASKCTCMCLEGSRLTYQMLADVETILVDDEVQKEKNSEKQKFLCALEHDGEYMDRRLPKYMRDKEEVIVTKLKSPTAGNSGTNNGH